MIVPMIPSFCLGFTPAFGAFTGDVEVNCTRCPFLGLTLSVSSSFTLNLGHCLGLRLGAGAFAFSASPSAIALVLSQAPILLPALLSPIAPLDFLPFQPRYSVGVVRGVRTFSSRRHGCWCLG